MTIEIPGREMRLPIFVRCADGRWYRDLVYQDAPVARRWFVCFDPKEPAELVVRASLNVDVRAILKARGFLSPGPVAHISAGRKDPHLRFFGVEDGKAVEGHSAISFFLAFRRGVPLPTPNQYDSCVDVTPIFPNIDGVYFGELR